MNLVDPWRTIHIKPSVVSSTSPSTLLEGERLSVLLNESVVPNSSSPSKYSSPSIPRRAYQQQLVAANQEHGTVRSSMQPPRSNVASAGFDDVARTMSSIERETQRTRDTIARLTGHHHTSPGFSPTSPADQRTLSGNDWTLSPSAILSEMNLQTPHSGAGDDRRHMYGSPTSVRNKFSYLRTNPANLTDQSQRPSSSPLEDGARLTHKKPILVQEYSSLLRSSSAMNKYLGRSTATRMEGSKPPSGVGESSTLQSDHRLVTSPMSLSAASSPPIYPRKDPLRDLFTADGRVDVDRLGLDGLVLQGDTNYLKTVTSSMRLLMIFQRWLLSRNREQIMSSSPGSSCNAVLVLHAHFSLLNDFVSSLFGLEQWLRDKMRIVVCSEVKAYVFAKWTREYGVTAAARTHWRTKRLRMGFEVCLEHAMKRRMRRRNGLHALALRRLHSNPHHMSPTLRTRRVGPTSDSSDASTISINRTHVQDARYSTSMSMREVLYNVKLAIFVYSRSGHNSDTLRVKMDDYVGAQDSVALLFHFRRLHLRCVLLPRAKTVERMVEHRVLRSSFGLWSETWTGRLSWELSRQPAVESAQRRILVVRTMFAFRRLRRHIKLSRDRKQRLSRYSSEIKSKTVFVRALHMIRCPAYLKCFLSLKQNYLEQSLPPAEFRKAEELNRMLRRRSSLSDFRRRVASIRSGRLGSFRNDLGRAFLQKLLMRGGTRLLLRVEDYITTSTFFALPAVKHMYIPVHMIQQVMDMMKLHVAMRRLRIVAKSPRIFFSAPELRFAQLVGRIGSCVPAAQRFKYFRSMNASCCRILPARSLINSRVLLRASSDGGVKRRPDEKPYRLVRTDAKLLTLALSTPRSPACDEDLDLRKMMAVAKVLFEGSSKDKGVHPSVPITAVLLLSLRRWRQFRRVTMHLLKAKGELSLRVKLKLLLQSWSAWMEACSDKRSGESHATRRGFAVMRRHLQISCRVSRAIATVQLLVMRKALLKLSEMVARKKADTKQHVHRFCNAVIGCGSSGALHFVRHHQLVPQSIRGFLSNHRHFRFASASRGGSLSPSSSESDRRSSVYSALLKVRDSCSLEEHPLDHSSSPRRASTLYRSILRTITQPTRAASQVPAIRSFSSSEVEQLEAATSLYFSYWLAIGLARYFALKRAVGCLRRRQRRRAVGSRILRRIFQPHQLAFVRLLQKNRSQMLHRKAVERLLYRRTWQLVKCSCVFSRRILRLKGMWFRKMMVAHRHQVVWRIWDNFCINSLRGSFKRLRRYSSHLQSAYKICDGVHRRQQLAFAFRSMSLRLAVSRWQAVRMRLRVVCRLARIANLSIRAHDRDYTVRCYRLLRHFQALEPNTVSLRKQRLSEVIALSFRRRYGLVMGLSALWGGNSLQHPLRRQLSKVALFYRFAVTVTAFRSANSHRCFGEPFRSYEASSDFYSGGGGVGHSSSDVRYAARHRTDRLKAIRGGPTAYRSSLIALRTTPVGGWDDFRERFPSSPMTAAASSHRHQDRTVLPNSPGDDRRGGYSPPINHRTGRVDRNDDNAGLPLIGIQRESDVLINRYSRSNQVVGHSSTGGAISGSTFLPSTLGEQLSLSERSRRGRNATPSSSATSRRELAPMAVLRREHSPMAASRRELSPMAASPRELSPMAASRRELSPMAASPNSRGDDPPRHRRRQASISFADLIPGSPVYPGIISSSSSYSRKHEASSPDSWSSYYRDETAGSIDYSGSIRRTQQRSVHNRHHEEAHSRLVLCQHYLLRRLLERWKGRFEYEQRLQRSCSLAFAFFLRRVATQCLRRYAWLLDLRGWQRGLCRRAMLTRGLKSLRRRTHRQAEQAGVLCFAWDYYCVVEMRRSMRKWRTRIRKQHKTSLHYLSAQLFHAAKNYHLFFISIKASSRRFRLMHPISQSNAPYAHLTTADNLTRDRPLRVLSRASLNSLLHYNSTRASI